MPLCGDHGCSVFRLKQRVAGSDLVPLLAERGATKGWRFYFIGAAPGVAARAADILTTRHPGLQVLGVISPPHSTVVEMPSDVIHRIREAKPDILLVAFGNPKQEKWIHMHLRSLDVPVAMGVGASLDFIAGTQRRAPKWMQATGTEWIHRLLQDPKRMWRRYTTGLLHFVSIIFRQWWHLNRQTRSNQQEIVRSGSEPDIQLRRKDGSESLEVRPLYCRPLIAGRCESLLIQVQSLFQSGRLESCKPMFIFPMQDVKHIDSVGLGALVQITQQARAAGGDLRLEGLHPSIRKIIHELKLDRYLTLEELFSGYWEDVLQVKPDRRIWRS